VAAGGISGTRRDIGYQAGVPNDEGGHMHDRTRWDAMREGENEMLETVEYEDGRCLGAGQATLRSSAPACCRSPDSRAPQTSSQIPSKC
jgi:hypothetical protein